MHARRAIPFPGLSGSLDGHSLVYVSIAGWLHLAYEEKTYLSLSHFSGIYTNDNLWLAFYGYTGGGGESSEMDRKSRRLISRMLIFRYVV